MAVSPRWGLTSGALLLVALRVGVVATSCARESGLWATSGAWWHPSGLGVVGCVPWITITGISFMYRYFP